MFICIYVYIYNLYIIHRMHDTTIVGFCALCRTKRGAEWKIGKAYDAL